MLPTRDDVRLATVVIRPEAAGRYPAVMLRTPYATTSLDGYGGLFKALFEADYAVIVQNERGSEWSEGESGSWPHDGRRDGHARLDRRAGVVERPGRPARRSRARGLLTAPH